MASEIQNGLEMIPHLDILNHTLKYFFGPRNVDLCFAVENRKRGKKEEEE
jgi:hypothetical protein